MPKSKMTQKEKEERKKFLENEAIEHRTKRVLEPRIKRTIKEIRFITKSVKSPRYKLNEEQITAILGAFSAELLKLENSMLENDTEQNVEFEL